jgi:hypothetical protein
MEWRNIGQASKNKLIKFHITFQSSEDASWYQKLRWELLGTFGKVGEFFMAVW